jgi:hypothetical protein
LHETLGMITQMFNLSIQIIQNGFLFIISFLLLLFVYKKVCLCKIILEGRLIVLGGVLLGLINWSR